MTVSDVVVGSDGRARCWWCVDDPVYRDYHDEEWGRPVHDDRRLYEKLCLEGFQAGLSWLTVLRRRPALRDAFAGFEPTAVADFDDDDVERLLDDDRLIRHRGKIEAAIGNARATLRIQEERGSLDTVVWAHAPEEHRRPRGRDELPARTPTSAALARELKSYGFSYLGPTTAYAFMQAMGLVDDHIEGCEFSTEVG